MIATTELLETLDKIKEYIGSWNDSESVPTIERDYVKRELQSVYDAVTHIDRSENSSHSDVEVELIFDEQEPEPESAAEPTPESQFDAVEPTVAQPTVEPTAQPVVESVVEPRVQPTVSKTDKLFSRLERHVIDSLYGESDDEINDKSENPSQVHPPVVAAETTETTPQHEPSEVSQQQEVEQHQQIQRVLGEILNQKPDNSLNELLSQQTPARDMATKLAADGGGSLRSWIGVNDRFMLVRELFGGNTDLYDHVIGLLDECKTAEEAFIYIQDNFRWNPDNEATRFLTDLISRKLA